MSVTMTERLIAYLASGGPSGPCSTGPEWDEFLTAAVAHTVAPQLFRRLLADAQTGAVPADVLRCIWVASMRQKQQMTAMSSDLKAVLQCLAARNIVPILLKGAHLATAVYPDPADRPMSDLDLLVRFGDLAAAEQALLDLGYRSMRDVPIAEYCARSHQLPRLSAAGRMDIELHWTIAKPASGILVDVEGVWARSRTVLVHDEVARTLSPEDLLLHICLHGGALHLFGEKGIRPLLDVHAILSRYTDELDWPLLIERARAWDVTGSVYLMLFLACEHTGAEVPDFVLANLMPDHISPAVVAAARAQLFELPGLRFVGTPEMVAGILTDSHARRSLAFGLARTEHASPTKIFRRLQKFVPVVYDFCAQSAKDMRVVSSGLRRLRNAIVLQRWLDSQSSRKSDGELLRPTNPYPKGVVGG